MNTSPARARATTCAFLCLILAAAAGPAGAATWHVPDDFPTIQPALDAADNGDTVLVAPGTYIGNGNRNLDLLGKDLRVIGEVGSAATIIDCQDASRAFTVDANPYPFTLIQGFTIRNGIGVTPSTAAGGAIRVVEASPTLRDLVIADCSSTSWGGGIHLYHASGSILEGIDVRGCAAVGHGGGISVWESSVSLDTVVVAGNQATARGGGLYCLDADATVAHLTAAGNDSGDDGDGIAIVGGIIDLQASLVALNTGTGLYVHEGTTVTSVACCDFWSNGDDYTGALPDQTGLAGNISAHPLFCDYGAGDLSLHVESPCLPTNNDCGVQMGALGRGCDDPRFDISGTILHEAGMPVSGVEIQGADYPVFTAGDGAYTLRVTAGWSGTLEPVHRGYTFAPPKRSYADVQSDLPGQDYVGFHQIVHHVPAEYAAIQDAIDAALSGDTIFVAPGTYTGEGNRNLDFNGEDIVLIGEGGPEETIIDAEGSARGFHFHNGETRLAVVRGFTIRNGAAGGVAPGGGGMLIEAASPSLVDLVFRDCNTPHSYCQPGGAIRCVSGSPLVQDVIVDHCYMTGISLTGGAPELIDVRISNCRGNWGEYYGSPGGGIRCDNSSATLVRVVFIENSVYVYPFGGGMYVEGPASPTLLDCRFEGNYAFCELFYDSYGGGFYCSGADPVLENVRFTSNYSWRGGGMYCEDGSPILRHVVFEDNHAEQGGGLAMADASPLLENLTFHANGSDYFWGDPGYGCGAAAYLLAGSAPTFNECIVGFSSAGPGIHAEAGASPTLGCCCVFGNAGGPFGGTMQDWIGVDGNFALDPLYCGDYNPDEPLAPCAGSPCAPDNNDCGLLVGALAVGCDNEAFVIAGRIADPGGAPLAGVELVDQTPRLFTDENGDYEVWKIEHWSGALQPELPGYVFDPPTRDYADLSADQTGQDFTGTRSTLHRVPGDHPDLQSALDAVVDGDTILVASGTYTGPDNRGLSTGGLAVSIIGEAGPEATVIDCENAGRAFGVTDGEGPETIIEGFTIRNGLGISTSGTSSGGAIFVNGSAPTLRDLRIYDCSGYYGGAVCLEGSFAVVERVVIAGCECDRDGAGINVRWGAPELRHVTLAGNDATWGGGGLACTEDAAPILEHVLVYDNYASAGGGIYCRSETAAPVIACCDVFANRTFDDDERDYGGYLDDQTGVNGNISADPMLCDYAGRDFHLHAQSPCAAGGACAEDIGALGVGCNHPVHLIAGVIMTEASEPLADVRLAGYQHDIRTDEDGAYAQQFPAGWSGTLAPDRRGYAFSPEQRSYVDLAGDMTGEDYVATRVRVHRVPADCAAIQDAMDMASHGDTVLVAPGTYTGSDNRELDPKGFDMTVLSEAGPEETIIDCQQLGRGFHVHCDETATMIISGFTIRNGNVDYLNWFGGAIMAHSASPTLTDLVLENCQSSYLGGAVYCRYSQTQMESITIRQCSSQGYGGCIYLEDGSHVITGSVLHHGHALNDGGGIYAVNAPLAVSNTTIAANSAGQRGGGVMLRNGSTATFDACLVAFNEADDGGGFHGTDLDCDPALTCCDVFGNEGGDFGGYATDPAGADGNIAANPEFCYLAGGDLTVSDASPCLPANNDCGVLIGALGEGCSSPTAAPDGMAPAVVTLNANYPNPFNPDTEIRFGLPEAAPVTLRIYDVAGRLTATLLAEEPLPAGWHTAVWRGRDDAGRPQASGVYLSRLEAGGKTLTRKMTLLK
ncbi:MAG: right-handed parallel beta-helix repeat-containing protein [Candidatus Krumholzibacteriota bacterium]|nr:right-handed parallel beta-helix repeat-containing protein [Candidatus Krumholzibacteriota bacterium]